MNFQKILCGLSILLVYGGLYSCEEEDKPLKKVRSSAAKLTFKSPKSGTQFTWGDTIHFDIALKKNETRTAEKINLFVNGDLISEENSASLIFDYPSSEGSGGNVKIKAVVKFSDGTSSRRRIGVKIWSDSPPKMLSYQLINTFDHNIKSYTQGLVYDSREDLLFEGTGNYTESRLLKVELGKTSPVKEIEIPDQYFAEGITLRNDTVFQLTYKRKTGFYYDREFKKLGEFNYPTEGWGLTHNDNHLIMSDGSASLFFLNPSTFKIEKTIQVFTDKGPMHNINELEYVNGVIYANIYTTQYIAKIDAISGKILALINMEGLLDNVDVKNKIDVLNGIAFNPQYQSFYVTGKWWPKLFELRFIEEVD
jgi:glutamine cyclotransferase